MTHIYYCPHLYKAAFGDGPLRRELREHHHDLQPPHPRAGGDAAVGVHVAAAAAPPHCRKVGYHLMTGRQNRCQRNRMASNQINE